MKLANGLLFFFYSSKISMSDPDFFLSWDPPNFSTPNSVTIFAHKEEGGGGRDTSDPFPGSASGFAPNDLLVCQANKNVCVIG